MTPDEITQIACDAGDQLHAVLPDEVAYALIILAKQGGQIAYCSKVHPRSMLQKLRDVLVPELERAIRDGDASEDEHPHVHEWVESIQENGRIWECRFCLERRRTDQPPPSRSGSEERSLLQLRERITKVVKTIDSRREWEMQPSFHRLVDALVEAARG
jgi:hypothetical protein